MEHAFHLPAPWAPATRPVAFGGVALEAADLTGADLRMILRELRARAVPGLESAQGRARALAAAARRFVDPLDSFHRRALAVLPQATGFSRPMIADRLPHLFAPITEASLLAVASRSAGAFVRVVGVISAGNVPGIALAKATLALTAGACCFVKTASGEPLLAALFAEALASVDPRLASSLAVAWWRGGDESLESALLEEADSLVVYGSDVAVAALRHRSPRPIVGHGHKLSTAIVRLDRGGAVAALAAEAALDVAAYDQLGCLSPQVLYTIGGENADRAAFVDALCAALDDLDRTLPPGTVPESDALAVHRFRDEYEWREIRGDAVSLRGAAGRWSVIDDPSPAFRPSPLHRTIVVARLAAIGELGDALGEWLPRVESVGMGPWPDPAGAVELERLGIPRIAPLGRMQSPDLEWCQGGQGPMAGIVIRDLA